MSSYRYLFSTVRWIIKREDSRIKPFQACETRQYGNRMSVVFTVLLCFPNVPKEVQAASASVNVDHKQERRPLLEKATVQYLCVAAGAEI
jgi:hypothetical protein